MTARSRNESMARRPAGGRPASALPGVLLLLLSILPGGACEPNNQGYAPEQPINYSHAVHAGAMEIPCQYCHFGADRGRYAGIPPTSICMNCHTQVLPTHPEIEKLRAALDAGEPIQWVRVHTLPDHVYFDHSVHVGAGVECQTCHGPVEQMARVEQHEPLTMGWCLDCHRVGGGEDVDPERGVPTGQATPLTDCAVCHH